MAKKDTIHYTQADYPTVVSPQPKPHHPVRRMGKPEVFFPVPPVPPTAEEQAAKDAEKAALKKAWLGPASIYDPESVYRGRRMTRSHVPKYNQLTKILVAFRIRETKLAEMLGVVPSTVFRWQMAPNRNGGCDGLIPIHWIKPIKELARKEGIVIPPQAWLPELTEKEDSE